jgi:hypothetical protein
MDDGFLAEQLRRIRQMSEQMAQARARLIQSSNRDETAASVGEGPQQGSESACRTSDPTRLHPIRDCRTYQTHDYRYEAARKGSTRARNESARPSRRRRRR